MTFKCQAGGSVHQNDERSSLSATTNTHFTFYGGHNGPAVAEMSAGRFPSDDVSDESSPCAKSALAHDHLQFFYSTSLQSVRAFLVEAESGSTIVSHALSPIWDYLTKRRGTKKEELTKAKILNKLIPTGYLMSGRLKI